MPRSEWDSVNRCDGRLSSNRFFTRQRSQVRLLYRPLFKVPGRWYFRRRSGFCRWTRCGLSVWFTPRLSRWGRRGSFAEPVGGWARAEDYAGDEAVADLITEPVEVACVFGSGRTRCFDFFGDDVLAAGLDDEVNFTAALFLAEVVPNSSIRTRRALPCLAPTAPSPSSGAGSWRACRSGVAVRPSRQGRIGSSRGPRTG